MGDVINIGDRVEFVSTVSTLDNMTRAINSARAMLEIFEPRDRIEIIGQILASACCEYGGEHACRTNALYQFGEFSGSVISAINVTFPPADSEGLR
jgi:hypothetical protein